MSLIAYALPTLCAAGCQAFTREEGGERTHQDFWESGMTTRTSHPRRACSVLAKEKMLGEESHGGPSSFCGMSAGGGTSRGRGGRGTHGQEDDGALAVRLQGGHGGGGKAKI